MIAPLSENMRTRLTLAAVGLVQGLVYYLAYEYWPDGLISRAIVVAVVFFVSGFVLIFQLSWTGRDVRRLVVLASVPPLVFSIIAIWVWLQIPVGDVQYQFDDVRIPTSIASAVLVVLLTIPFIQVYVKTGKRAYPYADLFNGFWNNLLVMAVGGVVIWAFWAVILLWSELFKLIDITFFEDVFTDVAFVCMSLATVFGYAVALGKEWERLTTTSRSVLFILLKALMPLLAVIALLFLASLPFTGLQPLWDTRHASATLLALIGATILFFNGTYTDGTGDPPYSLWIRRLVAAALVAIPVYTAIAFLALYLRIEQYGLTFGRFYGVLFTSGGMLCGLGYALAVLKRRGTWMELVPRVNMALVWVVIVFAVLVHTPLLDPLRWSARSQFRRLSDGIVNAREFDYGYLRFQLGHIGYETLGAIEELDDHPQAQIISERIAVTRAAESYADVRPQPETLISASDIVTLDSTATLPDSLVRFVVTNLTQFEADDCEANRDCTMFPVNLDADEDAEYLLLLSGERNYSIVVFDRDEDGKWMRAGRLTRYDRRVRLPPRAALIATLRQDGVIAEETRYRDVIIGDHRLRVMR